MSFDPPAGTILPAGPGQVLTVSITATNDYNAGFATTTINVLPAPLTVTANNTSKVAGQANPTFTAQFSGFVNGDGPANLGGMLTFTTEASASSPPGQYPITPGGLTSANYAITYVNGTLAVTSTSTTSTTTSVTASPNPGTAGQPITFTATVTNTSGATIPTGTVDLMNGATTIGMGTLGSNGQASIMVTLPQGSYSITAVYAGNSNFQGSSSQANQFTVNAPTPAPTPTPTPTPPPTFLGEHRSTVKVKKKKILEFVLSFSAALRSSSASYLITQPGRTKKSAPKRVGIGSATLGPGGTSVILVLGTYNTAKPLSLTATGLTGANGAAVASVVVPRL